MVNIVLGPGKRLEVVGAALRGLEPLGSTRDRKDRAGGHAGSARASLVVGLRDLTELSDPPHAEGRLVLDADELLSDEIDLAARFLKRHPRWHLALLGADRCSTAAQSLLGGGRVAWLEWPPDLECIRALLDPLPPSAGESGDPVDFDLHLLVEELLVDRVLAGDTRHRFSSRGDLRLRAARSELRGGLAQLLWIAARCAGERGLLELTAEGRADFVHLAIEFPPGPLPLEEGRRALARDTLARCLSPDAARRSARAARALRGHGARLRAGSTQNGSLRVELDLPRRPGG